MKFKRIANVLLVVFIMSLVFVGCSGNKSTSSTSTDSEGSVKELKIATASTSGAFYPIGGAMASILSKNMDGFNFTAEATGGSQENARLIQTGKNHIAFMGADSVYEAVNGLGNFKDNAVELKGIAQLYVNPFHIIVLDSSKIKTIDDLENKKVAVGEPGSGTSNKAKILLGEYGFEFDENLDAEYLGFSEGSKALIDGTVDAVIISVGLPSGNVQELQASHDIRLLSFSEERAKQISKKYPYFSRTVIPAGTYSGIDGDTITMGAPNELVVDPKLSEETVYQITKILFGTKFDELKGSHNAMKVLTAEIASQTSIPLHPGAEKFYKEIGAIK